MIVTKLPRITDNETFRDKNWTGSGQRYFPDHTWILFNFSSYRGLVIKIKLFGACNGNIGTTDGRNSEEGIRKRFQDPMGVNIQQKDISAVVNRRPIQSHGAEEGSPQILLRI